VSGGGHSENYCVLFIDLVGAFDGAPRPPRDVLFTLMKNMGWGGLHALCHPANSSSSGGQHDG
jgi:hypothetical protein